MAQQYCDYIKAAQSRIEREQQLKEKYSQKPNPIRQRSLWMHDIERYENSQELKWLAVTMVAAAIVFILVLFYYS